ncbi:unnamed protein product [Camellia sinensis]
MFGRVGDRMATECSRISFSETEEFFFFKGFSAVSDWFAQPPPQPWLNSRGSHAHRAPLTTSRQTGTQAKAPTCLAIMSGTPFDELGTPFDGTPFYGLGTPFDGTPFDGTPF